MVGLLQPTISLNQEAHDGEMAAGPPSTLQQVGEGEDVECQKRRACRVVRGHIPSTEKECTSFFNKQW